MDEIAQLLGEAARPLKVPEYLALARRGAFDGQRVELVRGCLLWKAPHSPERAFAIGVLTEQLVEHFGKWATVRPSLPLNASEDSMPEPDFALVPRMHAPAPHPTKALLLIEVSHTSLRLDRVVKAPLYAEGGSPEYWIVDVERAELQVFRKPVDGAWTEQFTLGARDTIRPVSFPDVEFALAPVLLGLRH
jgi:Uma2 family endonuclease